MYKQLQDYIMDNKIILRIVIVALVALIIIIQLSGNRSFLSHSSKHHNFAWERMPTQGKYVLNIERFDREVALVQLNPAQFAMIYKRRNLYIPAIEKALKQAWLPDDLKYIPIIESALRENAVSSAGAVGVRQFMPDTARRYGLIVNDFVDERYDVHKSTDAAIHYFQDLYKKFSNWTLAAAAYNRGENGLQRSMESQFADNYYDLWLNNETARYVFRLLATKYVRENKYTFFDRTMLGTMYTAPTTTEINVRAIENIAERAHNNGYSYYEIKRLNPWITKNTLPEGRRDITVFPKK